MICNEKKPVLFGSVIYKSALQYFEEFMSSIKMQTIDEFGVLLLLDGVYIEEINNEILSIKDRCKVIECGTDFNPQQLRVKLIQEAKKCGVDILVMGDADDLFSADRIESVVKTFRKYAYAGFVYNDLCFFNGARAMPELPEQVYNIRDIAEKNFLGMSNTAIRVSLLDDYFITSLFECDSFIFDWYLYSRLLLAGYRGVKAKEASTLYRIYDGNYIGIWEATEENIEKEIEVKKQHYKLLSKEEPLFEKLYDCYSNNKIQKIDLERELCRYWWNFTKLK